MRVEQYVMAYGVEHDRLRAILPDGFISLRPVLRINAEVRDDSVGYLEFNTAVEKDGQRGWLNIAFWTDVPFSRCGRTVTFSPAGLKIAFTGVGLQGGCPAEKDNSGCFFLDDEPRFLPAERITANKEFCDCTFAWCMDGAGASGSSIGMTLPAIPEQVMTVYPKKALTVENAALIPCKQVLGSYVVRFTR